MKVLDCIEKKQPYMQKAMPHNEFGQRRREFTFMGGQDVGFNASEGFSVFGMQK